MVVVNKIKLVLVILFFVSGIKSYAQCKYRETAGGIRYFTLAGITSGSPTSYVNFYEDEDLDRARTFQLRVTVSSLGAGVTDKLLLPGTAGYDWWVEISGPNNDFTNPTLTSISTGTWAPVPATGILNFTCIWPEAIRGDLSTGIRSLRVAIGNAERSGSVAGQPSISERRGISNSIPITVVAVTPSASIGVISGSSWSLGPGGQLSFNFNASGSFKSYNTVILEAIDGPTNGVGLNWSNAAMVSFIPVPSGGFYEIGGYAPYLRKDGSKFAAGTILHYRLRSSAPIRYSPVYSNNGPNNGSATAFENFTATGLNGTTVLQTLNIGGSGSLNSTVHTTALNYICRANPIAQFVFTTEAGAFGSDNYYVELLNPATSTTPPQILNCVTMPLNPNALVACPTSTTGMNCIFPILYSITHVRIDASLVGVPDGSYQIRVTGGRQYKRSIRIPVTISQSSCRVAVDNSAIDTDVIPSNELSVFPNPASKDFKIELRGGSEEKFEIFGIDGKLVSSARLVNGSADVSTQKFGKGIYHVKVNTKAGYITSKLVVE